MRPLKQLENIKLKEMGMNKVVCLIVICFIIFSFPLTSQPSGGPYGPVLQKYSLPKVTGTIFYVAPDGKLNETGATINNPTTIESAIERVKTGDAIVLRGGTYRTGNLLLNQGITIQPYNNEQPIFKGTLVASEWKNLRNGLWKTTWKRLFPAKPDTWWSRDRFGKTTPMHRFNNDVVFADGKFLQSVGSESEVDENSFYINYESEQIYIGVDPEKHLIEITAFDIAIKRITGKCHNKVSDKKGFIVKGITFTQYAYRAIEVEGTEPEGISHESKHGKDVVGTTFEHCTISYCSRVAAYLRGDKLTIRNCKITDTSMEGIYIIASSDVLLEKNIFTRNNIEQIAGYYPAAVKIFNQSYRVTCNDNLVIDLPYSNGIWYDVGNIDGVFVNNWIENVGILNREFSKNRPWPSDNGFFFEISSKAICAGNVFVNCDQGIFILNSSDVQMYNNTFINSVVCIARNDRSPVNDATFGWHSATGPVVAKRDGHVFANNLLTATKDFQKPLLYVWQPDTSSKIFDKPQLKYFDNNVFVQQLSKVSLPFIYWTPSIDNDRQLTFNSLEELQKMYPSYSKNSYFFTDLIPLFKSCYMKNYQLLQPFPGIKHAVTLPSEVRKLLRLSQKDNKYIGAYPSNP